MDRQEAVQKLATAGRLSIAHAEDLYDSFFSRPVVPQCVANWYEEIKGEFYLNLHYFAWDIFESLDENACVPEKALDDDFTRWYRKNKNAIQIIVNMHQFGYEVEKEAKYTVRLKGLTSKRSYLNYLIEDDRWYLNDEVSSVAARTQHTRKELEKGGFGEVFDNPMFEVKEVE